MKKQILLFSNLLTLLLVITLFGDLKVYAMEMETQVNSSELEVIDAVVSDVVINTVIETVENFETEITNVENDCNRIPEETSEIEEFVMPTVDNIVSEKNCKYKTHVGGTDKWNEMLYTHATGRNIDPIFFKVIMAIESSGHINVRSISGKHYGPFQISKDFGFDNNRLLNDPDYAAECALDVIYEKIRIVKAEGEIPTVYVIAKRYNGSSSYADKVSQIYEELSGNTKDKIIFFDENLE